jgi:hypothetical protein
MPLTVFDCKGISATRRGASRRPSRATGSTSLSRTRAGSPRTHSRGGVRVLITEPQRFERMVAFAATKRAQAHRTPRRAPAHGRRAAETLGDPRGKPRPWRRRHTTKSAGNERRLSPEGRAWIVAATKWR